MAKGLVLRALKRISVRFQAEKRFPFMLRLKIQAIAVFTLSVWISCGIAGPSLTLDAQDTDFDNGDPANDATVLGPLGTGTLKDLPISPIQIELLDLAFQAPSLMPRNPHIKNRCRAQERVVGFALDLGQPSRAIRYTIEIDNWRRALAYTDFLEYAIKHGAPELAPEYLRRAKLVSEGAEDWRLERILAGIARVQLMLGDIEQSEETGGELTGSDRGAINSVASGPDDAKAYARQLALVDAAIEAADFELIRSSVKGITEFYENTYSNLDRRIEIEGRIQRVLGLKLPEPVKVEVLVGMGEAAAANGDLQKTGQFADQAFEITQAIGYRAEILVPMLGDVGRITALAGNKVASEERLAAGLEAYERGKPTIMGIFRTEALEPVARGYMALGDSSTAEAVYLSALNEAIDNPNSRPRAEDFSALCCSMAVSGFEPDVDLMERLRTIRRELGDPW